MPNPIYYNGISERPRQHGKTSQKSAKFFSRADIVGNFTIFNISGNNYRLITFIDYEYQLIFIRRLLTHAEYNKENWKNDSWFKNS
ncbi:MULTISPECIES: type II toxin-antitoxin system HigB family toxin [Microcoleaceae]|uniref:type II toxin-antitoxin system HigB family toxin n=1 Tax=Microcoleaceae TaxID=1892252 RepID=UPI002102BB65|nr:type II toxin-antitoxin system HigB family toxin [Tychonema sp. LEGE 06208]